MKKTLLLSALLCPLIFTSAQAQNGIYVSLEGGIAEQNGLPTKEDVGATDLKTSYAPNAVRASVGYNHDLFSIFGIGFEAGLGQYGKSTYTYADGAETKVVARTLEFLAVGTFHLDPKFDVFAKIGGLRQTPTISGRNAPETTAKIATQTAIGAAYNFTPNLALTLTYTHVFGSQVKTLKELDGQAPSLNEGMLGIRYTFGS
jgi:opacity protein-like surface antigen